MLTNRNLGLCEVSLELVMVAVGNIARIAFCNSGGAVSVTAKISLTTLRVLGTL
jgi:hypothetical protein